MKMKVFFAGIDPGKSGAIALIEGSATGFIASVSVWAMPTTLREVFETMKNIPSVGIAPVALEKVHAMPGQGVTSMFTFGQGYGWLEMGLTALDIPFERVTPHKWQKALGCLSGGDKHVTLAKAQELFPKVTIYTKTGRKRESVPPTLATADALLLAKYAMGEA